MPAAPGSVEFGGRKEAWAGSWPRTAIIELTLTTQQNLLDEGVLWGGPKFIF